MKLAIGLLLCICLGIACSYSPYPGYNRTASGIHYQIHYLGDGERKPIDGDLISFDLKVFDLSDSLRYQEQSAVLNERPALVYNENLKGGIHEALSMLQAGDSASFIISNRSLALENMAFLVPLVKDIEQFKLSVKVHRIMNAEELSKTLETMRWKLDAEMNEHIVLSEFLKFNEVDTSYFTDGVYVIPQARGNGKRPKRGQTVKLHYRAFFIDSTKLDDTYFLNRPLEIEWGAPGQLLKGFEIGLQQLSEDGKAILIIPSQYAFGERGSSNGSVPPYTTLIYDVHVVDVE